MKKGDKKDKEEEELAEADPRFRFLKEHLETKHKVKDEHYWTMKKNASYVVCLNLLKLTLFY